MIGLTDLEVAALRSIFSETPELADGLERQLAVAVVTKRENSGVGFFTDLAIPEEAPRVASASVLGYETHAHVKGIEHFLGFVLFVRDGRMSLLEGYSFGDDSTTGLDLAALDFEVFKMPVTRVGF